jgi:hypothetical protein
MNEASIGTMTSGSRSLARPFCSSRPSALAKNGQFVLSKSGPLKEQDLAQCKHTKSSIIRAEGA